MSELLFRLEDRWGSILGTCIGVSVVIAFHYLIVWLRKEKKPGKKSILEKKKLWLIIYVLALVLEAAPGFLEDFLGTIRREFWQFPFSAWRLRGSIFYTVCCIFTEEQRGQ